MPRRKPAPDPDYPPEVLSHKKPTADTDCLNPMFEHDGRVSCLDIHGRDRLLEALILVHGVNHVR